MADRYTGNAELELLASETSLDLGFPETQRWPSSAALPIAGTSKSRDAQCNKLWRMAVFPRTDG